jgi:hypothetical protein
MRSAVLFVFVLACGPAFGQGAKLQLNLDHLAAKAEKVVNVNVDGSMLEMSREFLGGKKGPAVAGAEAEAKEMLEGLQGVYVRSFEFANAGAYSDSDVEAIRKQLTGPGWVSFVDVKDSKKGETVSIYAYMEGGKQTGMVVLAAEPKELTVVNIVGQVDLAKLGKLQGKMLGFPKMKGLAPGGGKPATTPTPKDE